MSLAVRDHALCCPVTTIIGICSRCQKLQSSPVHAAVYMPPVLQQACRPRCRQLAQARREYKELLLSPAAADPEVLNHTAERGGTLLKVSACMSIWSLPHSGQVSVMVTVTDLWFESLLHRPCNATAQQVISLQVALHLSCTPLRRHSSTSSHQLRTAWNWSQLSFTQSWARIWLYARALHPCKPFTAGT